ncbi:MAG: nucleotidyltransferase family protein [Methylophilus sp.]|nr:nucleotidyltransferase family protein [Methylophilus sp.]
MIGILLAAGFSRRFGAANKLLHPLPDGRAIAIASAEHLITALPVSVAVVREGNQSLSDALKALGFHVVYCESDATQMADSLVLAIRYAAALSATARGYVIALADMPFIAPSTINAVANALAQGAEIVIPTYADKPGHPVGFSTKYKEALLQLSGDEGARSIIKQHIDKVLLLDCDDTGILADIDTPADLA